VIKRYNKCDTYLDIYSCIVAILDISVLKHIYRVFENWTGIVFVFGHFKMSSYRHFLTAAEAARQIHEYASEFDDVDSDIELESRLVGANLDVAT